MNMITFAGLETKPCELTKHELAEIIARHVGKDQLIAICVDLGDAIPPAPTHSRTIKRRRANVSPDGLIRTTRWCAKAFQKHIGGSDTQRKIVRKITDSQISEIDLEVFALTFFDAITPEDPDKVNLERMIEYDKLRNLGYSDWLKAHIAEGKQ